MALYLNTKDYSFVSFILGFLQYNPSKRFTPQQALCHPFMKKIFPFRVVFFNTNYSSLHFDLLSHNNNSNDNNLRISNTLNNSQLPINNKQIHQTNNDNYQNIPQNSPRSNSSLYSPFRNNNNINQQRRNSPMSKFDPNNRNFNNNNQYINSNNINNNINNNNNNNNNNLRRASTHPTNFAQNNSPVTKREPKVKQEEELFNKLDKLSQHKIQSQRPSTNNINNNSNNNNNNNFNNVNSIVNNNMNNNNNNVNNIKYNNNNNDNQSAPFYSLNNTNAKSGQSNPSLQSREMNFRLNQSNPNLVTSPISNSPNYQQNSSSASSPSSSDDNVNKHTRKVEVSVTKQTQIHIFNNSVHNLKKPKDINTRLKELKVFLCFNDLCNIY